MASGSYEEWRLKVNAAVQRLAGVSLDDLADFCDRDAYDDGYGPIETARRAIRADRGDD